MSEDPGNENIKEAEEPVSDMSPVVLTDRDLALFQLAHEQRFLCYNQIMDAFWKERSPDAKA